VGDDVIHPGPLRAPVRFLACFNAPTGSLRAQAEVRLDTEVQAMEEVGGGESPSGPLMGPVGQEGPWALLEQREAKAPSSRGAAERRLSR